MNAATDTLCFTLTSCLSSRPARSAPSNPWLYDVLREHRTRLRSAERKWRKSNNPLDRSRYQSLLSSFSAEVHTAKSSHFHNKINSAPDMRNLFRTFNSLLCPPSPPPTTSITADDFANFFTDKTRTISSQFSPPHTEDLQPTTSTAQTPIFSFCPLTEALTHIINTSLFIGIFPTVSLLSFIAKTLEQVVFNQVSLFLSQNNKLDAKESGFRSGHSIETTLSNWSPANCKRWFQIISHHSAGSICRFWHCQSSDPPVHPLITGHHWDSTSLVWILSHWSVFQGGLGRGGIKSTSIGYWGSPGIGSWTPPLLPIHYITGSHHTGAWLLLPLLRWWHTALSLFPTRWCSSSCAGLRLPGRHLGMDERTSSTAQPGKDWASCLPCHSNSTAWLHDSVRFINNYTINFGQKSWCNLWWPADLQKS